MLVIFPFLISEHRVGSDRRGSTDGPYSQRNSSENPTEPQALRCRLQETQMRTSNIELNLHANACCNCLKSLFVTRFFMRTTKFC